MDIYGHVFGAYTYVTMCTCRCIACMCLSVFVCVENVVSTHPDSTEKYKLNTIHVIHGLINGRHLQSRFIEVPEVVDDVTGKRLISQTSS